MDRTFFLLDEKSVIEYVKKMFREFAESEELEASEIGDGNLNYVFRVRDVKTQKSVIIKQAGEELRISSEMRLPISRGKHEYMYYLEMNKLYSGMMPRVFFYDDVMCVIAMEDMIGSEVMRKYLLKQNICEDFAEQITDYLAAMLRTTIFIKCGAGRKNAAQFENSALCKITEDLVFTCPYLEDCDSNNITEGNQTFIKTEIFDDNTLKSEVGKLKYKFMTCSQALIHGDLHTGSIFVKDNKVTVFDPEFSFYGPIGYDIGNVIANLIFSFFNNQSKKDEMVVAFYDWVLDTITSVVNLYVEKYNAFFAMNEVDNMFGSDCFKEHLLGDILADTAGYTGTEIIRRIVGMAKCEDFTSIEDVGDRIRLERKCILFAKELIMNRNVYIKGEYYKNRLAEVLHGE